MIASLRSYAAIALLLFTVACDDDSSMQMPAEALHWQISAQYVADTMLLNDDALTELLEDREFISVTDRVICCGIYGHYRGMAERMRLKPPPALYLDMKNTMSTPQAAARFTRKGKAYIIFNKAALTRWSARQFVAVLGHELVHLKERHVTAENLAQAYNHPELSVAHEMQADHVGSGPSGSCDPKALEEALHVVIDSDRQDYLGNNPLKTSGDYDDLNSSDHPHWAERKAALDDMIQNPPVGCGF